MNVHYRNDMSDASCEWSGSTDDARGSQTDDQSDMLSSSGEEGLQKSAHSAKQTHHHQEIEEKYTKPRYDVTDAIMDKIDMELDTMTRLKVPGKQRKHKKTGSVKSLQDKEDVLFVATNGQSKGKGTGIPTIRLSKGSVDKEGTVDTGLGTSSLHDDRTATTGEEKHIVGNADTYTDNTESSCSNLSEEEEGEGSVKHVTHPVGQFEYELDSDAAQQVDENYRQIMKKKRGGYLTGFKTKGNQVSDVESVKTEDFEDRFREIMEQKAADMLPSVVKPTQFESKNEPKGVSRKLFSDLESMCTEDLLRECAKLTASESNPRMDKPQQKMRMSRHRKSGKKAGSGQSDRESVQTEDFENYFHKAMVKQVAQVPITSFDQYIVDSDLDTVKSAMIKNKFHQAMNRMADHSEMSSSDTESTPRMDERRPDKHTNGAMKRMPAAAWVSPQRAASMQNIPSGMFVQIPYHMISGQGQVQGQVQDHQQGHKKVKSGRHSSKRSGNQRMRSAPNLNLPTPYEDLPEDTADELTRETARIRQELEDERRLKVGSHFPGGTMATNGSAISLSTPDLHLLNTSNYGNSCYDNTNKMSLEKAEEDRTKLVQELNKLKLTIQKANQDKQSSLTELKDVQEKLRIHRTDIRQVDQTIKENRAKAENARTDLMLLEFKRESAKKDLQRTEEELKRKRSEIEEAGFKSKEELSAVRAECEDMRSRIQQSEGLEREIRELERQMEVNKESQLAEQKKYRMRVEELEEDRDATEQQLEELKADRDAMERKLSKVDAKFKAMEKTKNELIQEKNSEYEELRDRLQEQLNTARATASQEVIDLRAQFNDVNNKLSEAQKEMTQKDEELGQLREKIGQLEHEVGQHEEKVATIREEHNKNNESIRANFKREIEEALTSVRIALEKDKRESLEQLECDLEERYNTDINHLEESLRQQIATLQGQLTGKEVEVGVLKDRVQQHEESSRTLGEVLRKDAQQQVLSAVESERARALAERERAIQEAISSAVPDHERVVRTLREELGTERDLCQQQATQLEHIRKEMEEARQQNRQLYMDKLTAMNQAKETAQQEKDKQIDQLKEQIEKETLRQIERLRATIERQEEEISRLRSEKTETVHTQQDTLTSIERQEKMVIQEINEECKKTADVLGLSPRKVIIPSFSSSLTQSKSNYSVCGPMKTALTSALANLRASHEELRKHVVEIKQDLSNQKAALNQTSLIKSQELEAMKIKFSQEKTNAMESLKDRLIKEHLHEVGKFTKGLGSGESFHRALREKDNELQEILRNMALWKEQTAEKLATKFQEEMSRELEKRLKEHRRAEREWEREKSSKTREIEKLERDLQRTHASAILTSTGRPPLRDPNTVRSLTQLQAQLRHLQAENQSLKRASWRTMSAASTSTPDLTSVGIRATSPTPFIHQSSAPSSPSSKALITSPMTTATLEDRVKQAERRAAIAGDRAARNEQLLNSKMAELNKVNSNMSQQSKELMQLERAYNHLQRQSPMR